MLLLALITNNTSWEMKIERANKIKSKIWFHLQTLIFATKMQLIKRDASYSVTKSPSTLLIWIHSLKLSLTLRLNIWVWIAKCLFFLETESELTLELQWNQMSSSECKLTSTVQPFQSHSEPDIEAETVNQDFLAMMLWLLIQWLAKTQ